MSITEQELHDRGIRLTPQRRFILEAIHESRGHLSAEAIYHKVQALYPYMNISTVYRNLELLRELRLVTVTDLGGGCVLYEAASKQPHHHLVCLKCGSVEEISDDLLADFKASVERRHGFLPDMDHFAIFGTCTRCRQAATLEQRAS